jgi:hypothetical protein
MWRGRSPGASDTLVQRAVSVRTGTSPFGPVVAAYVLGTWEETPGNFHLRVERYPWIGPGVPSNHLPDAKAVFPQQASGAAEAVAMAVAYDEFGAARVYVTGKVPGSPGHWDVITVAYDTGLNQLWTARFSSSRFEDDAPVGIAANAEHIAVRRMGRPP